MGETVDEKAEEDGLGVESVVVGIACDHLVALGCGENNGICLLYDITDISSPSLLKTFHLSESSQTKNPAQSYRQDLGDIDSETILWIPASRSPTSNSGFLFGGAISGTLSFYEFQCLEAEDPCFPDECPAGKKDSGLSGGAIAGITIGAVGAALFAAVAVKKSMSGGDKGPNASGAGGTGHDVA